MEILAERLKALRKSTGKSMYFVAKQIGVSLPCYRKYEMNLSNPGFDILMKLASHFNVSIDYLLGHKNSPELSDENLIYIADNFHLSEEKVKELVEFIKSVNEEN